MFQLVSILLCSFAFNTNHFFDEKIEKIQPTIADNVLGINQDCYAYQINQECYLVYDEVQYHLQNGNLVDVCIDQNNIYILINCNDDSTIFKFSQTTKKINSFEQKKIKFTTIEIYQQLIIVGGCDNNDAVIYLFDSHLQLLDTYCYGGEGYEAISMIRVSDKAIYLSIEKSGISNNSGFVNIGTKEQIKSIIIKLDTEFKIDEIFYFNHQQNVEIVFDMFVTKKQVEVVLKVDNDYFYYLFDLDLKLLTYKQVILNYAYEDLYFLLNYKSNSDCLFLEYYQDQIALKLNNDKEEIYNFMTNGIIKDICINQGLLYLYIIQDQKLKIVSLSEYEIIKNDPIIINRYHSTYDFNQYLVVESYFEDLVFKEKNMNPYFSNTISGIYTITYEAVKENQDSILISGELVVETYTNFINNGVYPKGKKLEFFGNAVMNNKIIYNGTTLDEVGMYEIEITDANQKTTKYQLYIVDNYYREINDVNLEYEINTAKDAFVSYQLSDEIEIIDLIINNQSYDNYVLEDGLLTINFLRNNNCFSYQIDKIIYLENGEEKVLNINRIVDICYLKKVPIIDVNKTVTKDNLIINLNIVDDEQAFMYMKVVTKNLGKVINEEIVVDNVKYTFQNDFQSDLLIYYVYHLGNGEIRDVLVYECLTSSNLMYQIMINSEQDIVINVEIPENLSTVKTMKVANVDVLSIIDNQLDNSFKKVIIFASVFLLGIDLFLILLGVLYKQKKRNTLDN